MSVIAAIRPETWNWALLVHVAGAMVLVGGLLAAGAATVLASRDATGTLGRFSYVTLAAVALPGFVVMRAGAQWIYDEEGFTGDDDPAWIAIGFGTSDLSGLLLLIALVVGGIGLRRSRGGDGGRLLRASGVIALVLLLFYVVAVWAMAGKPA